MNSSWFISTPECEFILLNSTPARALKHLPGKPETKGRSPGKGSFLPHSHPHSTHISPPVLLQALHATEGGENDGWTPGSPAVATTGSRRLSQEPLWVPCHITYLHTPQHILLLLCSHDAGNTSMSRVMCYYHDFTNLLPVSADNQSSLPKELSLSRGL